MAPMAADPHLAIRRHLRAGLVLALLLVVGIGGWATVTELSGAVIAPGVLVVDSDTKKVQHPSGGIIGALHVRDGDQVRAGEVLARLDETRARAALAIIARGLDEFAARQARLEAEMEGAGAPVFPEQLLARTDDAQVERLISGEHRLFEVRGQFRAGQKRQLQERVAQLQKEIEGLTGQAAAKTRELELVQEELSGLRKLREKQLVPIKGVMELERTAAQLAGDKQQLSAATAQAKGKIAEIELQILQIDQELRTEVGKELAEIRAKTAELFEKKVAAEDDLLRIEIRAPIDGTVHQLSVHTIGGVIGAGETVMMLVPHVDVLMVESRLPPQEIDRVHIGQKSVLRFPAFNVQTTPEVNGEVSRISADISEDERTGQHYYTVRIVVSEAEIARLGSVKLLPGMPVEAFLQTEQRTVLSYLTKPLQDQITRAFRER
jgi:HlyD family secretion protein